MPLLFYDTPLSTGGNHAYSQRVLAPRTGRCGRGGHAAVRPGARAERTVPRRDRRHRGQARADAAGGADRGVRDRRGDDSKGADFRRARPADPDPLVAGHAAAVVGEHELRDSRFRQRRQQPGHRTLGRRLHRRRLPQPHRVGDFGPAQPAARRGAARSAVHAVRQERVGRRHQRRHAGAAVRVGRQRGARRRQLRRHRRQGRRHRPDLRQPRVQPVRQRQHARRLLRQSRGRQRDQRPRPLGRARPAAVGPERSHVVPVHRRLRRDRRELLWHRQPAGWSDR